MLRTYTEEASPMKRSKSNLSFIREFIRDRNVASLFPTSSFAVKRAFKTMDLANLKIIVEYGPGDGAFTRRLLKLLPPDARLIAIETNLRFVKELERISDSRLTVVHDSAENILSILEELGYANVDCILSGIPFTFLKTRQRVSIVQKSREALKPDGVFLVYQNSYYAVKYLEKEFSSIKRDFEPRNLPPLFIMRCMP